MSFIKTFHCSLLKEESLLFNLSRVASTFESQQSLPRGVPKSEASEQLRLMNSRCTQSNYCVFIPIYYIIFMPIVLYNSYMCMYERTYVYVCVCGLFLGEAKATRCPQSADERV